MLQAALQEACARGLARSEAEALLVKYRQGLAALLAHEDWRCWLAEEQGSALGMVLVRYAIDHSGHKELRIVEAFVQPRERGQGLARRLLDCALKEAAAAGCRRARLNVRKGIPAAVFWQSCGFHLESVELECSIA